MGEDSDVSKIRKVIGGILGGITVLTAGVAIKNAMEVRTDEETGHRQGFYEKYVKRTLDFFCASTATIVLSPVLTVTALLVRIKLGSPVLFTQDRPGKDEIIFKLIKFRTMTDERDEKGALLPDADRLTPFGALLRSTSIDEIPELFNILRGDMSLIGPRPLLVQYLKRYNEEQHHRHDVRPGLTGYAQAHGRNNVCWEDKFAMDVWYTKNVTFINDVKIVLDTIKTVLSHEGISSESSVTMEEFMGTPEGVNASWRAPK